MGAGVVLCLDGRGGEGSGVELTWRVFRTIPPAVQFVKGLLISRTILIIDLCEFVNGVLMTKGLWMWKFDEDPTVSNPFRGRGLEKGNRAFRSCQSHDIVPLGLRSRILALYLNLSSRSQLEGAKPRPILRFDGQVESPKNPIYDYRDVKATVPPWSIFPCF